MAYPLITLTQNHVGMFQSNIKIAVRHLRKNKFFTAIKLTGLIAGFLGCLLIGLYLQNELSYDSCHEHANRIVRTTMEYRSGGETARSCYTGNKVGPALKAEFPEVEAAVRVIKYDNTPVSLGEKRFEESDFYYADSSFFEVFTFPLLEGNPKQALSAPNQLVLDASSARKYFGNENPLGKTLIVRSTEYQITGVMADAPVNTQLKPRFVAAFANLRDAATDRQTWWNANYATYFLLRNAADQEKLEAKITPFMRSRANETGMEGENFLTYHFEPLREVHLRSQVEGNFEPNGDIRYIYLLATVGLLILFIGVTTYVNLTTAVSMERSKEIGVQKVLGANRWQLLQQHLGEAGVLTGISLLASLALAAPVLPVFNRLFDRELSTATMLQPGW